jgi:WD40 repeat protein
MIRDEHVAINISPLCGDDSVQILQRTNRKTFGAKPGAFVNHFLIFRAALPLQIVILFAGLLPGASIFAQTGRSQRLLAEPADAINAIQFSPDGSTLAIAWGGRDDNRVELWDTQTGNLRHTIRGFDGPVWSVSFSPDSGALVTGSGGTHKEKVAEKLRRQTGRWFTELKWWDAQTGDLINQFELPAKEVMSINAAYSPDGRVLAVVENRLTLGLADLNYAVGSAAVSDALRRRIVNSRSGYMASRLTLVDPRTGEPRLKLKDGYNAVQVPMFQSRLRGDALTLNAVVRLRPPVFSPDGQLLAAWKPNEARVWNSANGAEVIKINKFKGELVALAFSPDGRLIAGAIAKVTVKDNQVEFSTEIRIWEVAGGAPKQIFPSSTHSISSLSFANNSAQLLIGGLQFVNDRPYASMELMDLEAGSVGKIVAKDEGNISSIALSPDGETLAFQTDATTVKLLTTRGWRTKHTLSPDDSRAGASLGRFLVSVKTVPAVAFLADGAMVAGAIEEGGIKIWDARTGEAKRVLAQEAETGNVAAISRNGATVAEVSAEHAVRVWDLESGISKKATDNKASAIGLSGDGQTLAVAESRRILIMNTGDLKVRRVIEGFESPISFIVLSSDGKNVAAALNGLVKIWRTDDGALSQTIAAGGEVSALQFGPRDRIAIGRKDGSAGLWSISRGTINFELRKHTAAVNAIAFSDDGSLIATGGDDRTAVIWESSSGKSQRTLKGHDLAITSLAFSPNGMLLAVGSGNASVVLWQVEKGKLDRVLK